MKLFSLAGITFLLLDENIFFFIFIEEADQIHGFIDIILYNNLIKCINMIASLTSDHSLHLIVSVSQSVSLPIF